MRFGGVIDLYGRRRRRRRGMELQLSTTPTEKNEMNEGLLLLLRMIDRNGKKRKIETREKGRRKEEEEDVRGWRGTSGKAAGASHRSSRAGEKKTLSKKGMMREYVKGWRVQRAIGTE
ncbi:hypothetical protein B9Z55_009675 [Caenorhabditis nigoni]|uniref:Uncharacterized protein n=1 Tax=Caenorhabditis nigoni TaxID=1611254 RepID=A0A2G5USZ5_9PELO|nr:hypothetical protein B9Z55_009675 [Caenorhabditis nigoni]